ncbi:MAG: prolyl oligopeptidase family serine peptidase [Ectothiorhodospiraceae bacterium]|nr:prolyl oligopeptidase family serine peptidase [Ectothiorhodospiraceae bacterium]
MLDPVLRDRAFAFLPAAVRAGVLNPMVRPQWSDDGRRFWYRREVVDGWRFVMVDADTGATSPAFDHHALAAALTRAGVTAPVERLPIERVTISGAGGVAFTSGVRDWHFDGESLRSTPTPSRPGEVVSPDGRLAAFRRGHDLWLRELATDIERPLTTDGGPHHAYAKSADMNLATVSLARRGIVLPAGVRWSPDSRRLFTSRLDERDVADLPLLQHVPDDGSRRPVVHHLRFANAGDDVVPLESHLVIDVATGACTWARCRPHVVGMMTCIERDEAWWSTDGNRLWFVDRDRGSRRVALCELDAADGAVREVLVECVDTFHDTNVHVLGLPNIRILEDSGEVIWFSQRDGWGHLYLHDLASGALKSAITSGEWLVRDIVGVDPRRREVFVLGACRAPGADPQHRQLCVASLDGGALRVLTPEPGEHALAIPTRRMPRDHIAPAMPPGAWRSPTGEHFVETTADLTSPPVTTLRRRDGAVVATLEVATLTPELAARWRYPTPFTALAADGVTVLHGAYWLPGDFDPTRRYPIIDYIYPGPQRGIVPAVAFTDHLGELGQACMPQAFAELGCMVVKLDGRGQPLRSKALHDQAFANMGNPGMLEDHVAVLRQLAHRHAFVDLERVGIMGHSGGGYASVRALLEHPDFFHVAVATAGNHDNRGYSFAWTEKYQGDLVRNPDGTTNHDAAANPPLVDRLRGKLLLAHGDMDDNVHPALTHQLVAALIAADKDFDMLVLPNDDHATVWSNRWFLRRAMAFMVHHLRMR